MKSHTLEIRMEWARCSNIRNVNHHTCAVKACNTYKHNQQFSEAVKHIAFVDFNKKFYFFLLFVNF